MAKRIDPSWFQTFEQLDPADSQSLIKVREKILKQALAKTSAVECKQIKNILNNLLEAQKEEKIEGKTIGQLIAERMEKEDLMEGVEITGGLGVISHKEKSNEALAKYNTLMKEYKESIKNLEGEISDPPEDAKEALRIFLQEQGRLNKIRGDVFEGFIQLAMETIKEQVEDLSNIEVNNLLKDVEQSLLSTKTFKTAGSEHVKTGKSGSSSQGKIDISIIQEGPFKEDWNITAKSYSKMRDISLLSGGNAPEIIGVWPASNKVKNYYKNAISVWSPGGKGIDNYLKETEKIIGIQGLVSHKGTAFANYLILYIRNKKKDPIMVIPIHEYMKKILEDPKENPFIVNFQSRFEIDGVEKEIKNLPALNKNISRTPKIAKQVFENLKIKKVALKSSYLAKKKLQSLGI